ncbi:hypothetical protein EU538_02385 [Candidatus Thorarchaeota archaeon]|jgi:hypothetical protein|nr:MAG: hypothetical protein EU538_02385 [Candidatus Thorarchaeota archaeon]
MAIVGGILLFVWGIWMMLTDILEGYVLWWYNLSIVLFGFAIFGLGLLVIEGLRAMRNLFKFGLHPDRSSQESGHNQTEPMSPHTEPEGGTDKG